MRKLITILSVAAISMISAFTASAREYTLTDGPVSVTVNSEGRLVHLLNKETGLDYAGGAGLWRLYYDTHDAREVQIVGANQTPASVTKKNGVITIVYDKMSSPVEENIPFTLTLNIYIEDGLVRFGCNIENGREGSVIREIHYPLVGDMKIPSNYKLLTAKEGGNLYTNWRKMVVDAPLASLSGAYKNQAQKFRQYDVKYPTRVAANCFSFLDEEKNGIYFGSHDPSFQDTWHGIRFYPDSKGVFNRLEAGFFKYPNILYGESWACDANCIAPYKGTWHETSKIYRKWADTWFDHRTAPQWVREMKSWQRIILKHQYGEYFFKYPDINGHIKEVGESVGCNTIFMFGWWKEGMDNGYPAYSPDDTQGGDEALSAEIKKYVADGGHLMVYFNGKLIDRSSDFYQNGNGRKVCYLDNTGADLCEQYRFTGEGTFLGTLNARSFVVADTRNQEWRDILIAHADRAMALGGSSVFYDQLGYGEMNSTNWDLSREFPIPNMRVAADKAEVLKLIRDHVAEKDPDFALGTEWLTDVTAQYCDYIHMYSTTASSTSFTDWFRYTFPEIIFSDREIRDDTDIPRRVNNTLLKGLRNDIEIWRCRGLIDQTPTYQAYLAKANAIKDKYLDPMVCGRYNDIFGFTNSNKDVDARSFVTWDGGSKMVVVCTNAQKKAQLMETDIIADGYRFVSYETLGDAKVSADGTHVTLGQYDLAVLMFEKL